MKPPPFEYVRVESVQQALDELHADPEAKALAGGQSLVALLNLRLARPSRLVDIGRLGELDRIFEDRDSLVLGGLVRHRRLENDPLVRRRAPLLAEAASHIGHLAIRNRGTLGGSLAHADPAGELPAVILALGGTCYTDSVDHGRRAIPIEDFFTSHYTTVLCADELLTWVRVPTVKRLEGWGFVEIARRSGDFAMAGAACTVCLDAAGRIDGVRAALMSAGPTPILVSDASPVGRWPDEELARELAAQWAPAQADTFRRLLANTALRRALVAAMQRAQQRRQEAGVG